MNAQLQLGQGLILLTLNLLTSAYNHTVQLHAIPVDSNGPHVHVLWQREIGE